MKMTTSRARQGRASVACRSTAAPVRPWCRVDPLVVESSNGAAKMRGNTRTLLERVMLNPSDGHSSMHSHRHTASAEEGFGDRERFFVIYGFKCGLPGMLVSAEPRNLRDVAQTLHRMVCHNFCCARARVCLCYCLKGEQPTSASVYWYLDQTSTCRLGKHQRKLSCHVSPDVS
jgi:hypothetical protein